MVRASLTTATVVSHLTPLSRRKPPRLHAETHPEKVTRPYQPRRYTHTHTNTYASFVFSIGPSTLFHCSFSIQEPSFFPISVDTEDSFVQRKKDIDLTSVRRRSPQAVPTGPKIYRRSVSENVLRLNVKKKKESEDNKGVHRLAGMLLNFGHEYR